MSLNYKPVMKEMSLNLYPNISLEFYGPFNRKSKSNLLLENVTRKRFCFKIKSNAPKNKILVCPRSGIIEPSQTINIVFELLPVGGTLICKPPKSYGIMVQSIKVLSTQVDLNSIWKTVDATDITNDYLNTTYNQANVPRSLDTTAEDLIKENIPINDQTQNLNTAMMESSSSKNKSSFYKDANSLQFQGPWNKTKESSTSATVAFSSDMTSSQELQLTPGGKHFVPFTDNREKIVQFRNPLINTVSNNVLKNGKYKKLNYSNRNARLASIRNRSQNIPQEDKASWMGAERWTANEKEMQTEKIADNRINGDFDANNDVLEKNLTGSDSNFTKPIAELGEKSGITAYIKYTALYNYETFDIDCLGFKTGDVLLVDPNDQPDSGWLQASLNDKKGWVPENYLERLVEQEDKSETWKNCNHYDKNSNVDDTVHQNQVLVSENGWGVGENEWRANNNGWGNKADLKDNSPNQNEWLQQEVVNSEENMSDNIASDGNKEGYSDKVENQNNGWCQDTDWGSSDAAPNEEIKYQALYDYDGAVPESLAFNSGDIIIVNPNDPADPGWLIGSLNGKVGWVPDNHLAIIDSDAGASSENNSEPINLHVLRNDKEAVSPMKQNSMGTNSIENLIDAMNRRDSELGNQIKDYILIALFIFVFGIILGKAGF